MKITPLKFILFISLILVAIFLKPESKPVHNNTSLNSKSVVLSFGDSLTYGKGAPSQSYPIQLQKLITMEVVNAGISGETSSLGLKRLPRVLKKYHPSLVILCHGGNDLLQKKSKKILKNNLRRMIQMSKENGAKVLLIGVPNFKMIRFSTEALYEELAKEEQVFYEGNILEKIENNSELKSNRIHPNAQGYALMAEAFAKVLKENNLVRN